MKVVVLGSGAFGLALGALWHQYSDSEVVLWTPFQEEYKQINTNHEVSVLPGIKLDASLKVTTDLKEALVDSDLVVVAVPLGAISSLFAQVKNICDNVSVVVVSKGIDATCHQRPQELYQESGLTGDYGYLGGPTFAIDVIENVPTGFVLATCSDDVKNKVKKLFENTNITISETCDIVGVEYCSALKNVFAILMGAIRAKYPSESTKAYFLTLFYQEFQRLVVSLGGKIDTLSTFAGLGDLLLTCNSCSSRNYTYGMLLVTNFEKAAIYSKETTVEGKDTLYSVLSLLKEKNIYSKLLSFLQQLIDAYVTIDELELL